MREIKFKAWLEDCQLMLNEITVYASDMIGLHYESFEEQLNDSLLDLEFDGDYVLKKGGELEVVFNPMQGDEWIFIESKNYKLMQFTNLKDKNGLDMYDGDVFECDEILYQIYWCDETLSWWAKYSNDTIPLMEFKNDAILKGNIYKNPELKIQNNG